MKNFNRASSKEARSPCTPELTRVPLLWNHPKTVALVSVGGVTLPKRSAFAKP